LRKTLPATKRIRMETGTSFSGVIGKGVRHPKTRQRLGAQAPLPVAPFFFDAGGWNLREKHAVNILSAGSNRVSQTAFPSSKMKTTFARLISALLLAVTALFSSGCASALVVVKAKGKMPKRTYATGEGIVAETLPNGDLQLRVRNERKEDKADASFVLLVPRKELDLRRAQAPEKDGWRTTTLNARMHDEWQPGGTPVPVVTLPAFAWRKAFAEAAGGDTASLLVRPTRRTRGKNARPPYVEIYFADAGANGRRAIMPVGKISAPAPGYYALLPVSIGVDLVTSPVQVAIVIVALAVVK
jgi:hypothetical protein